MNSEANIIGTLSFGEKSIYIGSSYNLEKMLNYIGYKSSSFICEKYTSLKEINNFFIGNWYS